MWVDGEVRWVESQKQVDVLPSSRFYRLATKNVRDARNKKFIKT